MEKTQLEFFLYHMDGNWISHKTIYYLKNKTFTNNQAKIRINITKKHSNQLLTNENINIEQFHQHNILNKNIIYKYNIETKDKLHTTGKLEKINNDVHKEYLFNFQDSCLKLQKKIKNINYTEYIYFINKKFILAIIIIKKQQNYIAVGFNSNIKINENSQ